MDFTYYATEIITEFEKNAPVPTSNNDWNRDAENILLYLAAKKYIERYGS